jgi:hypothetical protein
MKSDLIIKSSYSGMMYSHDFQLWYTYFNRRLKIGWSPYELSFLLGKPDHAYMDFEKLFEVPKFLFSESILLDSIYACSEIVPMEFYRERYEASRERIVRIKIVEDEVKWNYRIDVPWTFQRGKDKPAAPLLSLEEWKPEINLLVESDAMIHVRSRLEGLLARGGFEGGKSSWELFQNVRYTGLTKLVIYPRHLKNCLYQMIQQGKIVVRNVDDRYSFSVL